jgi:hypothetical protein
MPLVSATQMTALRSIANNGLDTPITIKRPTQIVTDYGSEDSFAVVASTNGWIREMGSPNASEMVSFIAATGTFRLHTPYGTDLQPGDTVTAGGVDFEVVDTNSDNTVRIFTSARLRRVE